MHELPPTYDLTDESFEGVEWNMILLSERGIDDFLRREQSDVQHRSQDGVMDESMLGGDRVLVDSKLLKTFTDECIQPCLCIGASDGVAEGFAVSRVTGKLAFNVRDRCGDVGVLRGFGREGWCVLLGELFAIVFIKGPLPAGRVSISIDKYPHAFALRLVKGRHERFFTAGDVFF